MSGVDMGVVALRRHNRSFEGGRPLPMTLRVTLATEEFIRSRWRILKRADRAFFEEHQCTWQGQDRDLRIRRAMRRRVKLRILTLRASKTSQPPSAAYKLHLNVVSAGLEQVLYQCAGSLEEYENCATLNSRLRGLARAMRLERELRQS